MARPAYASWRLALTGQYAELSMGARLVFREAWDAKSLHGHLPTDCRVLLCMAVGVGLRPSRLAEHLWELEQQGYVSVEGNELALHVVEPGKPGEQRSAYFAPAPRLASSKVAPQKRGPTELELHENERSSSVATNFSSATELELHENERSSARVSSDSEGLRLISGGGTGIREEGKGIRERGKGDSRAPAHTHAPARDPGATPPPPRASPPVVEAFDSARQVLRRVGHLATGDEDPQGEAARLEACERRFGSSLLVGAIQELAAKLGTRDGAKHRKVLDLVTAAHNWAEVAQRREVSDARASGSVGTAGTTRREAHTALAESRFLQPDPAAMAADVDLD
jgi:hypothetical protein